MLITLPLVLAATEEVPVGFLALLGTISVAIIGFLGVRYAYMEKEIRKLRAFQWINSKKVEARSNYLEEKIEAAEDYIDTLQDHIRGELPPPPPKRPHVEKPNMASWDLTTRATEDELKKEIEDIQNEGIDTGSIETS